MVDDLKKGYYLLFIDGGIRANEQGEEGAIGVILREPDCGQVLATLAEGVGPVGSPLEAEYHALIHGLKLAAEKRLTYVAAFSDNRNVVNQITRGWNMHERATELCDEVEEALKPFKGWQLSWGSPRDEQRGRQACRSSLQRRPSNPCHRLTKTSSSRSRSAGATAGR